MDYEHNRLLFVQVSYDVGVGDNRNWSHLSYVQVPQSTILSKLEFEQEIFREVENGDSHISSFTEVRVVSERHH